MRREVERECVSEGKSEDVRMMRVRIRVRVRMTVECSWMINKGIKKEKTEPRRAG